jgi:nucleoside-diphosphate-sugar epimerase
MNTPTTPQSPPPVAVAGASGFVGRHIVVELLSRGYPVRALVRDLAKGRRVLPEGDGLTLVQGDAADPEAQQRLLRGAGAVVNSIGILREGGGRRGGDGKAQTFRRQHVECTNNLVAAAKEHGVSRFLQVSALGVSDDARTQYQRSKWDAELIVRRSGGGLAWTIFRPSLIHGAGSEFLKTAKGWVTGSAQPWFFLPYFSRPVHVDDVPLAAVRREPARVAPVAVEDVAWAVAESLERPLTIGEVINLAGPEELSWPEMLREIRDAVPSASGKLNPLGIPAEIAAIQAKIAKAIGLGGVLPFDEGMAVMGAMDSVASGDKARILLGFSPRPFRSTLRRYAAAI